MNTRLLSIAVCGALTSIVFAYTGREIFLTHPYLYIFMALTAYWAGALLGYYGHRAVVRYQAQRERWINRHDD